MPHRFGTTRSGRAAWQPAMALGFVVACTLGMAASAITDASRPALYGVAMFVATLPTASALAWVLLVDRHSIRGAVMHPEHSVEGAWYDQATRDAFHDLLIVIGVLTALTAVVPAMRGLGVPGVLTAIAAFAACDVSVRYLTNKRREG